MGFRAVLIQSVTEFLPVSSGAHLLLFCKGFVSPELLHLGTIIPVLIYFRRSLFKYFFQVVIGTLPVVCIGYLIKKYTNYSGMLYLMPWGVLAGVIFSLFSEMIFNASQKKVTFRNAFAIGLVQCFAFIPGFSRLGATLSAARLLGIDRETAATFSFLLSVPASLGAVVLSKPDMGDIIELIPYIFVEAAIGFVVLSLFMRLNSLWLSLMLNAYRLVIFWWLLQG